MKVTAKYREKTERRYCNEYQYRLKVLFRVTVYPYRVSILDEYRFPVTVPISASAIPLLSLSPSIPFTKELFFPSPAEQNPHPRFGNPIPNIVILRAYSISNKDNNWPNFNDYD